MSFTWYCSYTKLKKVSALPLIEVYSSLYNFAIANMRQACYMSLEGEGTKNAGQYFQQSAWIFEHLLTVVTQLPAGEATVDFSKESLLMASNLCLAQAQYLFFRKARDNKMKPATLAKICAQIAIYFQKAFESNQINPTLRAHENGHFANVLGYHSKYYMAMAYLQLAEGQVAFVDDKAKECGKCVTMLKMTVAKFDEAKPFVTVLGGAYKANFDKTYGEAVALRDKMVKEN